MSDIEKIEDELKEAKEKIHRIETYFKVGFAVAVIFGIAGSFGAKIISDVNEQIILAQSSTEDIVEEITETKNEAISAISSEKDASILEINNDAKNALNKELKKAKMVQVYKCPEGTGKWNPGGKWGSYGCQGQISTHPQCTNIEYPHSQKRDCENIGFLHLF